MKADMKIAIFGVGLIGGSFALALKTSGFSGKIVGFGRSMPNLNYALEHGIIDEISFSVMDAVKDASLVLLAVPVSQTGPLLETIAPYLAENTILTDAGSTKSDVVQAARGALGKNVCRFVPAHPIAGTEQSGAAAALPDLYRGKKTILTPLPENSPETVSAVREIWERCGAEVSEMSPEEHDEVFAAVSHLPHLLSFALVHDIAQRENRDLLLSFAASGFRDFTRIAASSAEMWVDICLSNRNSLLPEMESYMGELALLHDALEKSDAQKLKEIFSQASRLRSNWNLK